jgi:hypothetical protein
LPESNVTDGIDEHIRRLDVLVNQTAPMHPVARVRKRDGQA